MKKRIPYYRPDDFFGYSPVPSFGREEGGSKHLVVLVGAPGTGKSRYSTTYLSDFTHISGDKLKTVKRILKELEKAMVKGESVVVDATNPTQERRALYYDVAKRYGYKITVIQFLVDGHGWNKTRGGGSGKKGSKSKKSKSGKKGSKSERVPDVVYHKYFKALEPPTVSNTPGRVFRIV